MELPPTAKSVHEIRYLISELATASDSNLQIAPRIPYAGGLFTVVTGLLGLATGGAASAAGFIISAIGTAATIQQSAIWKKQEEDALKYGIRALHIIDTIGVDRIAAIWKMIGGDRFATCFNLMVVTLEMAADGNSFFYIRNGIQESVDDGFLYRLGDCTGVDPSDLEWRILEVLEIPEATIEMPAIKTIVLKNEGERMKSASPNQTSFGSEPLQGRGFNQSSQLPGKLDKPTSPIRSVSKLPAFFNSESKRLGVPAQEKVDKGIDVVDRFLSPQLKSAILIGEPGSGKGFIASHWIAAIRKSQSLAIYVINPKNDRKEAGYWDSADVVFPKHYPKWADSYFGELNYPDQIEWINAAIDSYKDWYKSHDRVPHILVIDDATAIYCAAKNDKPTFLTLQSLQTNLTTQGDSSRCFLLLIGHATNLSTYGGNRDTWAGTRKFYIYSALKSGATAIQNAAASTFFGKQLSQDEIEGVKGVADESPVGRVLFDGATGEWLPVARLENLSDYDRDSHSLLDSESKKESIPNRSSQGDLNHAATIGSGRSLVKDSSDSKDTSDLKAILNLDSDSEPTDKPPSEEMPSEDRSQLAVSAVEFAKQLRQYRNLRRDWFTVSTCNRTSVKLSHLYGGDKARLAVILDRLTEDGTLEKGVTTTGLAKYRLLPRK